MDNLQQVPYIVYESMVAKEERTQKKLIAVIVLLIMILAVSNGFWAYQWTNVDYIAEDSIEMDSQGNGTNNYIGNNGDIINGENDDQESKSQGTP